MERKSVRAFLDQAISPEDKALIIDAAMAAPTAGNQQLYTILDITDQALKKTLSETCDHQSFIEKAPMVLIFLADCRKWYNAYLEAGLKPRRPGVGDLMLAVCDAVIAAQNAVTCAQSLGIGSCYIGDIMEAYERHVELLHLPDCVFPAAMLVFGYPTKQQLERVKPERCEQKYIVHENAYQDMDGQTLRAMLKKELRAQPYEKWIEAFMNRKYNSDFAQEMTRSVAKYLTRYNT